MRTPEDYRQVAEIYKRDAAHVKNPLNRQRYLDLAKAFRDLADSLEKNPEAQQRIIAASET